MKQILIINDKTPFREGLKKLLEIKLGGNFEILEIDYNRFLSPLRILSTEPFLVITEKVVNKEMEQTLSKLKQKGSKIVILSEIEKIQECSLEMFDGFLLKGMTTKDLVIAVEQILENELYVHPEVGRVLLEKYTLLKTHA